MVYLSVLSFLAAVVYLRTGLTTFLSNKKSRLMRAFLLLAVSFSIWSFSSGFLYLAVNQMQYSLWNKIGAFGWCTVEALSLYFVLDLTENRLIKYKTFRILILAPAVFFLYMALFLFGPDIQTAPVISNIFYIGDFLYNFLYLGLCIVLILHWGIKSKSRIIKNQSAIIAASSLIPFLLNLLFSQIFPAMGLPEVPNMGQIFAMIMFFGIHYAINKYQFLSMPTAQITKELFDELPGLALLLDTKGTIIKINRQGNSLLGYIEKELIGIPARDILNNDQISGILEDCESIKTKLQFETVILQQSTGKEVPFRISILPLRSKSDLLRGVMVIGEDISATMALREEIENHMITNVRLKNSELLFRRLLEITPVATTLINRQSGRVIYMNNEAGVMFGSEDNALIGRHLKEFFEGTQELEQLKEALHENNKIVKSECQMRRTDKSTFYALVTVIPSLFHEEEVLLACVIDMTEQKKAEEYLKRKNEQINKLNAELLKLNKDLTEKSVTDGLTGLYNHQHINEILEAVIHKNAEFHKSFCVMMLDIDHFKRVNDQYGHLVGDHVLTEVAGLIVASTGVHVRVGRYGGEEFIAILESSELNEAAEIAERVRLSIQNNAFDKKNLKVTISVGLAQYCGESASILINKADMLLYRAKRNGRNRVEVEKMH